MLEVESNFSWSSTNQMVEREKEETGKEERKSWRMFGGKRSK